MIKEPWAIRKRSAESGVDSSVFDVVIVGAGPAGSAAAFFLAGAGHRVLLLDRSGFPREKACGDGLTSASLDFLHEMGLESALAGFQPVAGVRVHARGQNRRLGRQVSDSLGRVAPRREFDELLVRRAQDQGAILWQRTVATGLRFDGSGVCGVDIHREGKPATIRTRFVIAADGGPSRIAAQSGLYRPERWSMGVAMRGYYRCTAGIAPEFHIHVPLSLGDHSKAFAGYGWVFPVNSHLANVGVGLFPTRKSKDTPNLRTVFDRFLTKLKRESCGFRRAELTGRLRGGALISGNDPDLCHGRRVLLVGDAAGLVDPFTGEGIYGAMLSAKLAAQVIDDALGRPLLLNTDLREYGRLLADEFGERFRAGQRFLRTYGFIWRVIEETFDCDGSLFEAARTAALDFEGSRSQHFTLSDRSVLDRVPSVVREGVHAVGTLFGSILRSQNPFFWKMAKGLVRSELSFCRLALFFSSYDAGGRDNWAPAVEVATAMELCCLAFEVQSNAVEEPERPTRSAKRNPEARWANTFALMVGNCLLMEAYRILARQDSRICNLVGRAGNEYCSARIEANEAHPLEVSISEVLTLSERTSGTLFALACRLGCHLGGTSTSTALSLAAAGRELGVGCRLEMEIREILTDHCGSWSTHPVAERYRQTAPSFPMVWTLQRRRESCASGFGRDIERSVKEMRCNGSLTAAEVEVFSRINRASASLTKLTGAEAFREVLACLDRRPKSTPSWRRKQAS